ncbi:MAG: uroporphyrinogen-III C-methyltransferase [Hydrogenophaga sp.]
MTETPPIASPGAPPQPDTPRSAMPLPVVRPSSWPVGLALLLALMALVMAALVWQRLNLTQQELARRQQDVQVRAAQAVERAQQAEALAQELQARLAVAEVKLSEVVLQRSQLDELMLSLSRSRDDNLVQDLESALRLALQQAQLTGSAQPLLSALQAADKRIARAAQPRLNPVQRAVARDIARLQSAELTDVPSLVERLGELARAVDQWPLIPDIGAAVGGGATPSLPATAQSPTVAGADTRWWQGWDRVWRDLLQGLRDLVRVSRIDHPEAALLAPGEGFFLRENLKLQLLNARLGLLARQPVSAQADLLAVEALLNRYFHRESASVQAALVTLKQLRLQMSPVDVPRPDETLAALAAAAGGR